MSATRQPRLAIVIPVFKHSVLVTEAIASALREARESNGVAVIVNDGCPFPETHDVCLAFATAEPELVEYINTANGGLSAARNHGIRHALARFPSVEAVYLLDADNRLLPGAMRRALATLDDSGADWVYPNIDKFGLEWNGDFSAPYNSLRHLFQNICEAGSLFHRRMFDAGVFFDETMRQGYEDWDFWLQGLQAGFRGEPCAEFGLHYRARRESMVRDSDRDGNSIIATMQTKHKSLFAPRALLAAEHRNAPRYCIVDNAQRHYVFTSVPGLATEAGEVLDLDTAFWNNNLYPALHHFPNFVVCIDQRALDELHRLHLADAVFWQIEDALQTHAVVVVALEAKAGTLALRTDATYAEVLAAGPCIVALQASLLTECVLDSQTTWISTLRTPTPQPHTAALTLAAPFRASALARHGVRDQLASFFHLIDQLRASPFKRGVSQPWQWRETNAVIPSADLFRRVRTHLAAMAPLARTGLNEAPEIAFLLPILSFGGVEQVGLAVAQCFKAAGWRTRLVVTERNEIAAPERLPAIFDTILFLDDPSYAGWAPTELKYFGHELQSWPVYGRHDRLVGLLTGCAAVMVLQASHGYEVMGWLRRQGTVTINSLHLLDRDQFNTPAGHPYITLAYEHAFDLVCAPGHKLLSFCASVGMPQEKLVYLANAPSFTVNEKLLAHRLDELAALATPGAPWRKLRVLSIGRLDRQKGGERLAALVSAAKAAGLEVEWRFVGGRVVADGATEHGLTVEPPVYDRAAVMERLLWADAVVLLSRWEGSPLLILEAQCLGTVPIATDTGAVSEMIDDGVDGFLIPNTGLNEVVNTALAALEGLAESPEHRAGMGRAAIERMQAVTWANTAAELVARVSELAEAAAAKLAAPPRRP
jgi:glycosyltransferase involved in cell wall biosynthesis